MLTQLISGLSSEKNSDVIISSDIGIDMRLSGHVFIAKTRCNLPTSQRPPFDDRKSISGLSPSSAARMRKYLRECIAEYKTFITLTYPCGLGRDGLQCKKDLAAMLKRMRRYHELGKWDNNKYSTFWFMEFQANGAIHYHMFSTNQFPKTWLANAWFEVVGSDDERHLHAGSRIEFLRAGKHGMSSYASKYAAKATQKAIPDDFGWVGRFWGVSGQRGTLAADTFVSTEELTLNGITRRVNNVSSLLSSLKANNKLKIIIDKPDALVILLRSYDDYASLRNLLYLTVVTKNLEGPYKYYGEFDGCDIDGMEMGFEDYGKDML